MTPLHVEPGFRFEAFDRDGDPCSFEAIRSLAHGANSQSWLVRDQRDEFAVVKTPRFLEQPDTDLKIEEQLLQQLEHENVVRLLAVGDLGSQRILVSERLFVNPLLLTSQPEIRTHFPDDPGTRYYPLPARVGLKLALDLVRGVNHLHQRGFVHHDVKPSNLMVSYPLSMADPPHYLQLEAAVRGEMRGVLIDVGGSRAKAYLHDLNHGKTEEDFKLILPQLSPLYAPPEALIPRKMPWGMRPYLHVSLDLYAMALVVYALVTGRAAYDHLGLEHHDFDTLREVKELEQAGTAFPLAPEAVLGARGCQDVSQALLSWLQAATHRELRRRPTMQDAREEFERIYRDFKGDLPAPKRETVIEDEGMFFGSNSDTQRRARYKSFEERESLDGLGRGHVGAPKEGPDDA